MAAANVIDTYQSDLEQGIDRDSLDILETGGAILGILQDMTWFDQIVEGCRVVRSIQSLRPWSGSMQDYSLRDILDSFRGGGAGDPLDNVCALVGLKKKTSCDTETLAPNYGISVKELYENVTTLRQQLRVP